MFVRKLFRVPDKIKWLLLELVIVFIGVYLAFLFQSFNERSKTAKEKAKVYQALKYELETFRIDLPGRSAFSQTQLEKDVELARGGKYSDFGDWIFIEPQYDYQIVEYAINLQNTEIIDFKLYSQLIELHSEIKGLEHGESLIMEMSQRYVVIPSDVPQQSPEAKIRREDNLKNFGRFLRFMASRTQSLASVARESDEALQIINELMNPVVSKAIEAELIRSRVGLEDSVEEAVEFFLGFYPNFTKAEIETMYREKAH